MFTARRFRLIALTALSAFTFAQAAMAAMGCAALRADATRGNVAVMPSGEPCDMMDSVPALITLTHCAQHADVATADPAPSAFLPDAPVWPAIVLFAATGATPAAGHAYHAARILGPPPLRLTQRLRI